MIQLWRTVPVQTFDAEATIALGRDRPELLAVAQLALDAGRPIGGRDVTRELLGGLPEHVGWLVIDRCVHLGLLQQRGSRGPAELTEGGSIALEHGQVLVAEEGVFRFYLAADPLLDAALLHVAPLRSASAKESRDTLYEAKKGNAQHPQGGPPPNVLRQVALNQVLLSVVNGSMFEVRDAPRVGQAGPGGNVRLDLRWEPDGPAVVLVSGQLPGPGDEAAPLKADFRVETPEELQSFSYETMWTDLVEFASEVPSATLTQWRQLAKRRVLPASLAQLPEAARRSFSRDVEVPPVRFGQIGEFQASKMQKVELVPASQADASEWCHWLQWDAVSQGYATPAMIDAAAAKIRARFPHHSPRQMSAQDLLARAHRERADRRSWNLLAPSDLGLWSNG
jgi:hypothetical protein